MTNSLEELADRIIALSPDQKLYALIWMRHVNPDALAEALDKAEQVGRDGVIEGGQQDAKLAQS